MIDKYLKLLEYQETFPDKIKHIVDAFVSFYGEEKREEITYKLRDVLVLPYIPLTDLKTMIYKIKLEKNEELFSKLKEQSDFDDETFSKLKSYGEFPENLFFKYYNFIEKVKESNDPNLNTPWDLSSLDENITAKNILEGNLSPLMQKMEELKTVLLSLKSDYDAVYSKIKKFDDMTKIDTYSISSKYLYEYASKHKDLLGDEFDKIEEEYKQTKSVAAYRYPRLSLFCGSMTDSTIKLSCFDEISDRIIEENKSKYLIDEIKKDRITYFKLKGIDLGDDYSLYENSEECKKIKPSKEEIELYKTEKASYVRKYDEEVLEHYPIYRDCKRAIEQIPFYEQLDLEEAFKQGLTAVCPNFARRFGKPINYPIMIINLSREIEGLDMNIVHEFNHVYELKELSISGPEYHLICGWDLIDGNFKEINTDTGDRQYERFNEIINDLIAEAVCRRMHSKGHFLFSDPENVRYNSAGYRSTTFLVADFIKEFGPKIIESRKGDMNVIFDLVGKENFDELNQLFPEFEKYFGGLKILNWISAVKEGRETELTKKRKDIERRRNEILERMIEYSKIQKKTM